MKKVFTFLSDTIKSGTEASHKRLVSVASFVLLAILAMLSCFGYNCSSEFVYVFAALAGWQSYLTTKENKA